LYRGVGEVESGGKWTANSDGMFDENGSLSHSKCPYSSLKMEI
jgi:hypothetical protein